MEQHHQGRVASVARSLTIALVMLWSHVAHAGAGSGEPPSLAQALDTADLFQEEYRQDLATAVADAQKQVAAAAPGTARALALTLEARIRRLRAEYRAADECLERAEREPAVDAVTRARILVERHWNELDRFRTPWGSFNPLSDDAACVRPDLLRSHQVRPRAIRKAIDAIQIADPVQRQAAVNRAMALSQRAGSARAAAQARDVIVTGAKMSSTNNSLYNTILQNGLQIVDDDLVDAQRLDPLPADRAALLRARLAIPLQTLARSPTAGDAYIACNQPAKQIHPSDPRLDGQELLLCAERALFPQAIPETLGRLPVTPTLEDTTYRIASDALSSGGQARKGPPQASDLAVLAEAENHFRAANNRRGMARAALVRGAVALASAIDDGHPERALDPLTRAVALAGAAGDRILAQQGQIFLATAHALLRDRATANQTLRDVLDDIRRNHSFGTALGAGRILASLAAHAVFIQAEPSSAELLNDLATQLFAAGGISQEATHLQRRQALIQASVGRLLAASTTLTSALARPRTCGQSNSVTRLLTELDLHDELATWALDSFDAIALEREINAIDAVLQQLTPDLPRDIRAEQAAAMALREQEHTAEVVKTLRSKVAATQDPEERSRLEDAASSELRRGAERTLAMSTVLATRPLLNIRRTGLLQLRDRAAIVEDPDMPPSQYYLETERSARTSGTLGAELAARFASRRGDLARARTIWLGEVRSPSAQSGGPMSGLELSKQEVRRNNLNLAVSYAEATAQISAFDLADQALQAVERDFGATWYLELQHPWTGMSTYVATASGLGRHEQALAMARRMLDAIDGRRASLFDERFRISMIDVTSSSSVYGRAVEAAARAGRPREAIEFMERGKARSLQDRYASDREPAQRRVNELAQVVELLESIDASGGSGTDDPGRTRMTAELARRRAEYDAALRAAGLDGDTSGNLRGVADRVSQHLSSGTMVLDYFVTSSSVTVVALAAGQSPIIASTPVYGAVLEGLVRRLDSDLARRVRPDRIQADAVRLADIVFPPGPVRELVASPQTRELVLVPHGVLHEVPFAFLPVSGAPLVIHATVRSLPFADAALAPRAHPATAGTTSAAVFWHLGDDTSVPLLHAEAEARDIAALYQVRADPAPSRSSVITALQTASVVHLIAHGAASLTATEYSRIDLPARSPSDDGDLTVSDILLTTGNLAADTVVLSSCEMANSRRTPGDDGAGIARALLQKGVGAVVAPVWQIVDVPQDVMRDLHRGLSRGEPAATALANAQRHAFQIDKHPAFWAGFMVLGGNP